MWEKWGVSYLPWCTRPYILLKILKTHFTKRNLLWLPIYCFLNHCYVLNAKKNTNWLEWETILCVSSCRESEEMSTVVWMYASGLLALSNFNNILLHTFWKLFIFPLWCAWEAHRRSVICQCSEVFTFHLFPYCFAVGIRILLRKLSFFKWS